MLRWRLILGALFISAVAALMWIDAHGVGDWHYPGIALIPLALLLTVGGTQEYLSMVRTREPDVPRCALYFGNIAIVATAAIRNQHVSVYWQLAAFAGAFLLHVVIEVFRYDKDRSQRVTERLGLSVLGLVYIGLLMSFIVRLRLVGVASLFPLISMLVVVKAADIGAYTVGRLFGKHKLAPKLSPGKTVEGLFGGLLFSLLGAALVSYFAQFTVDQVSVFVVDKAVDSASGLVVETSNMVMIGGPSQFWHWFAYAIVVSLTGTLGDLIESLLKRDFARKDSSTWLLGFGGVLDIIDSLLLAAPVAWAFWHWGWIR
ncbi:MAG: hypothetical protein C0483_13545 [Pirellula sp.]|nr:hypothetical protein [Pirellula sp.]